MKVLCICEWGENRSVAVAHHLKFLGHETLAIGVKATTPATRRMLYRWADRIIVVDEYIRDFVTNDEQTHPDDKAKVQLWNMGPDRLEWSRPLNKQLTARVRQLVTEHKDEYVGTTPYWQR